MIALIPARAGSKRVPGKNTRLLAGHPLVAYTIAAAKASGVFSVVYVCSDAKATNDFAREMGVENYHRERADDNEPDFWWISRFFESRPMSDFAILRPTSPFRTAATIQRAFKQFCNRTDAHSIRAVEEVKQHPGKMWQTEFGCAMVPLIDKRWPPTQRGAIPIRRGPYDEPWHSKPTQMLPRVYVQNASLEMAHGWVIPAYRTISGERIYPFFTEGYEGFDINTEADFAEAERIAAAHPDVLPKVEVAV